MSISATTVTSPSRPNGSDRPQPTHRPSSHDQPTLLRTATAIMLDTLRWMMDTLKWMMDTLKWMTRPRDATDVAPTTTSTTTST